LTELIRKTEMVTTHLGRTDPYGQLTLPHMEHSVDPPSRAERVLKTRCSVVWRTGWQLWSELAQDDGHNVRWYSDTG